MRTLFFAILLTVLCCANTAQAAVELKQMYQARVPVASQAAADRDAALQEALQRTFIRVSGDDSLLAHEEVRLALQNVRNFVQQYGYQQGDDELLLWVQFDQPQVDRTIQSAGSGIWSNLRPELLFWLVLEDDRLQRSIIGTGDIEPLVDQLREQAQIRGLPVKLPLLDLNDSMSLSVLDLWARFDDRIDFASSRYDADGVVVARIYQSDRAVTDQAWTLDWTLKLADMRWRGEVSADERANLGAKLIADISKQLSYRYRISANAEAAGLWRVNIVNLPSVTDVLQAEQRLNSVPSVNRVQLVSYGEHQALFELHIQTEAEQIMRALDITKQFEPVNQQQRDSFATPVYRWSQP
ncbi:DUF2066 domain-containing protein [Pseudidiomarina donghaiensis]|nr:DUF2066 domain-containing protein [Pseudidiomarina donghaiensis]SFV24638.1 hypothetical protein SAMN04488139_2375 [Pseudidiomarina donghaiensis]